MYLLEIQQYLKILETKVDFIIIFFATCVTAIDPIHFIPLAFLTFSRSSFTDKLQLQIYKHIPNVHCGVENFL